MKLRIGKEDVNAVKEKYGKQNAVAGYVEEAKLFAIPLPKYYVAVVDDTNLTLVEMDMKFKEKEATTIPIPSIKSVKITGTVVKKIILETDSDVIKLLSKPLAVGNGDEQKMLLARLAELK